MVHLQPDGRALFDVTIAFMVIDIVAVLLRLLARRKTRAALALDDLWVIAGLVLVLAYGAVQIRGIVGAGGTLNIPKMSPSQAFISIESDYIFEILFPCAMTAIKLSILSFYRRIFSTQRFRYTSFVVDFLCVVWFFSCFFVLIFQCDPVKAGWTPALRASAKCFSIASFIFGSEFTNTLLDIAILFLPIHMIRKLQMPLRRKIVLSIIFLMGGLECITSIVRMAVIYRPSEESIPAEASTVLSIIELGLAVVCACLPTYRPLLPSETLSFDTITEWLRSLRSSGQSSEHSQLSNFTTGRPISEPPRYYNKLHDGQHDAIHLTSAVGRSKIGERDSEEVLDPHSTTGITVERSFDVV